MQDEVLEQGLGLTRRQAVTGRPRTVNRKPPNRAAYADASSTGGSIGVWLGVSTGVSTGIVSLRGMWW